MIVYFVWNLFLWFKTAFTIALKNGNIDIVNIFLEQDQIDINIQDFYFLFSIYYWIIWCYKLKHGNISNYFGHH